MKEIYLTDKLWVEVCLSCKKDMKKCPAVLPWEWVSCRRLYLRSRERRGVELR